MKFWGRKDGQFRSGGLLVGDRPFSFCSDARPGRSARATAGLCFTACDFDRFYGSMDPGPPPVPSVRTSPLAIWSLVLGILGVVLLVICIGPLFAIPAIICGHIAYSRIKRSGGALKGDGLALGGLITGYVCLPLALVWIPMMAAITIPNFVKVRETRHKNMCLGNLRRIEGAKEVWVLQNNKDTNSTPTMQELIPFLKGDTTLQCPAGGTYSINKVGVPPSCSIPSHDLFNPGSTIQELENNRTNSVR
jgi:hypothetical protein